MSEEHKNSFHATVVAAVGYHGVVSSGKILPVVGFDKYYIGDDGFVYSSQPRALARCSNLIGHELFGRLAVIKPQINNKGYFAIGLSRLKKCHMRFVHHLVLEAFVGPRPDDCEACHGDGNRKNNTVFNLRWDTPESNQADKKRHGTHIEGENVNSAILTEEQVSEIRKLCLGGGCYSEIAECFGVSRTTVNEIASGITWKHMPIAAEQIAMVERRKKEQFGRSKLGSDQVRQIRIRCESGERQNALAQEFGVSKATVSNIAKGKTRKYVLL